MDILEKRKAILFVGCSQPEHPGLSIKARALLPIIEKPLLQLVVEALVRQGCHDFQVFLDHHPEVIRSFLGGGERWGVKITYHYWDSDRSMAANLMRLELKAQDHYWVATAETLPGELLDSPAPIKALETIYELDGASACCGWGLLSGSSLASLCNACDFEELSRQIPTLPGLTSLRTQKLIDVRSDRTYLESTRRWLQLQYGNEVKLARGARIHPEAKVYGPVYIGANARVGAGGEIGPNVVIGHDAVVDHHAELTGCVILPETYVGQGLYIEEAVVSPNRLSSIKNDAVVESIEPHLIASARPQWRTGSWVYLPIFMLQAALWPLYVIGLIALRRSNSKLQEQAFVRMFQTDGSLQGAKETNLPLSNTNRMAYSGRCGFWLAHFIDTFYPGLRLVRAGQIGLFGLEIRDAQEVSMLPEYWQTLYNAYPCGLINENVLNLDAAKDSSIRYAFDACAAAGLTTGTRWRILKTYIGHVAGDILGLFRPGKLATRN